MSKLSDLISPSMTNKLIIYLIDQLGGELTISTEELDQIYNKAVRISLKGKADHRIILTVVSREDNDRCH